MSRSVAYRRIISDLVSWRHDQALNATIFILRNFGPTGFLLHEEGESKNYKVFLGDPHNCTCSNFIKEKDLCKHICWLLLKKYRLSRDNPITWQLGLVEREINEVLQGPRSSQSGDDTRNAGHLKETTVLNNEVQQRSIADDDVCPICQDGLLEARLPVTYCRSSCGNSVHIRCMRVWADHQRKQQSSSAQNDQVMCPVCRGDFASFSLLMKELQASGDRSLNLGKSTATVHRVACAHCHVQQIMGKCYRCVQCTDLYLCQRCFNLPAHPAHNFEFRERRSGVWQAATVALPGPVVGALQTRELEAEDYDLLHQLLSETTGSELTQSDIRSLPGYQLRNGSRLIGPGRQCRLCLMNFQIGDSVRRLPDCKHVFHVHCVDPLLLHRRAACPLDGRPVVPVSSISLHSKSTNSNTETVSAMPNTSLTVSGKSCSVQSADCPSLQPINRLPPLSLSRNRPPRFTKPQEHRIATHPLQQLRIGGTFSDAGYPPLPLSSGAEHGRRRQRLTPGPSFGAHKISETHGAQQRARSLSADRRNKQLQSELRLESRTISATRLI